MNIQNAGVEAPVTKGLLNEISQNVAELVNNTEKLKVAVDKAEEMTDDFVGQAEFVRDNVASAMLDVREYADKLESTVDSEYWPIPTYSDLIYSV